MIMTMMIWEEPHLCFSCTLVLFVFKRMGRAFTLVTSLFVFVALCLTLRTCCIFVLLNCRLLFDMRDNKMLMFIKVTPVLSFL